MKAFAAAHNIDIIYIPAGMTGIYQPLDTHINGILKQKLRAYWCAAAFSDTAGIDVLLPQTIKQATRILHEIKSKTIRDAFTDVLFAPAAVPRGAPNPNPRIHIEAPAAVFPLPLHAHRHAELVDQILASFTSFVQHAQ